MSAAQALTAYNFVKTVFLNFGFILFLSPVYNKQVNVLLVAKDGELSVGTEAPVQRGGTGLTSRGEKSHNVSVGHVLGRNGVISDY